MEFMTPIICLFDKAMVGYCLVIIKVLRELARYEGEYKKGNSKKKALYRENIPLF